MNLFKHDIVKSNNEKPGKFKSYWISKFITHIILHFGKGLDMTNQYRIWHESIITDFSMLYLSYNDLD